MMHYPWDGGALNLLRAIEARIGMPPQKSIKAKCGKRVAIAFSSTDHVDCPGCRASLIEDRDLHESVLANPDYQHNKLFQTTLRAAVTEINRVLA